MASSDSSPLPFKSKKPFTSPASKAIVSGESALSAKTPDSKPPPLINPNRIRNRGVALSISEVRSAAERLRQSNRGKPSSETKSVRKEILPCPIKKPKESDKLPQKYEELNRFFCNLEASIKLLKMRASIPTFTILSKQIECLSDRRFTHRHLSQLKYILPEVIEINSYLVTDERTSCMKPDLRITLNSEAVAKDSKSGLDTRPVDLRKVFQTRLLDFMKTHPKGEDIPEDPLPPPFNHAEHHRSSKESPSSISSSLQPTVTSEDFSEVEARFAGVSHLPQSFQRCFSSKRTVDNSPRVSSETVTAKSVSSNSETLIDKQRLSWTSASPIKETKSLQTSTPARTPRVESTPAKLASTPASMMASTPALQPPPKRSCFSPDDGPSSSPPSKLLRRLPHRSLKFDSPLKSSRVEDEMHVADDDAPFSGDDLDVLSEDLICSIRKKEKEAMEERNPAISQAKRRREIIKDLPKLFNTVYFIFQSSKRAVITRDELMYQIISSRFDMVDRKDVVEELEILKELAPEWISEKVTSSGDVLFRINKGISPSTIRAQLSEAK